MGKTGYAVILNEVNNLNLRPKKQDASCNSEGKFTTGTPGNSLPAPRPPTAQAGKPVPPQQ
jgi:hypothetical protein